MSVFPSTSKLSRNEFEDDDLFDDPAFLANIENSSFIQSKFFADNMNDSINKSNLNVSALCCDEELQGYDKLLGKTWVYPTNYPVRDYQFNIIRAAILKNTLVSLPTGLGKTFIGAVIMYNFYRWYPVGKIIFTAPTRPLVAQQIEACYDIVAIPPNDTIQMTGHMQVNTRKSHWETKRVIFATPQVIYNDIKSGICPCDKIRCLVIDEAHRARGNYAYGQIISCLDDLGHKTYRVVAMSATPGSKVEDVLSVIKSLHIAHLELRTETCIDVAAYSHSRKINTVVIQLGTELSQIRQDYVEILDGYARRLKQLNILPQNLGNLSKGRIVMLYKEFQNKDKGARHRDHNYIMKDFTLLIALYHGLELLVKHGSRVFLNFFDEHPEKSWIQSDDRLTALLERLRDDLGVNPLSLDRSILPDGTVPEMPRNLNFGHPKFDKLKQIMINHFTTANEKGLDTRAIVFCEYRESVNLVHCLLLQCRPLIKPQMFVGQGASGKEGKTVISQKQQLRVMRSFREGSCNTLVATCVAEEGLDVGSVDLILCFDISTRSPIRLVQRCGRTGRERGGQVYILVTEGREHQTLMDCIRQKDGLNKKILQSKEVMNSLYKMNPRMVPRDFMPECQKMYITVAKNNEKKNKNSGNKRNKKTNKDLRNMLIRRTSTNSSSSPTKDAGRKSGEQIKEMDPNKDIESIILEDSLESFAVSKDITMKKTQEINQTKLDTRLELQRSPNKIINIGNSKDTKICIELSKSDSKRIAIPSTIQNPTLHIHETKTRNITSPLKEKQSKKKPKAFISKSPSKRNGDIRSLFSTATKSTKTYTKLVSDLELSNDRSMPTSLFNLFVDLSLDNTNNTKKCYICENICDCKLFQKTSNNIKDSLLLDWIKNPNIPEFDASAALNFLKTYKKQENTKDIINMDGVLEANKLPHSPKHEIKGKIKTTPKFEESNIDKNFDLGDLEDIFALSSPEKCQEKETNSTYGRETRVSEVEKNVPVKNALGFFGLDSIEDIFADDDSDIDRCSSPNLNNHNVKQQNSKELSKGDNESLFENPPSPSILSGNAKEPTSPILGSQRKTQHNTLVYSPSYKSKNKLTLSTSYDKFHPTHNVNQSKPNNTRNSLEDKSMFTITQLVEMINKTDENGSITNNLKNYENNGISNNNNKERSCSPILLSQTKRKQSSTNLNRCRSVKSTVHNKSECVIVLDSDSDSDSTQIYEVKDVGTTRNTNATITNKRKLDDCDDDFMITSPYFTKKPKTNIETKPKKRKNNSLLDLEAELSGSDEGGSGDELSNDSIGSIIDFVCDDFVSQGEDIQAEYLKSVKSPIKQNGFKIPTLPNKYKNINVLSQYVEEDSYEMDSFCVDSHMGLTQINDVSELELAERALEERRKEKKKHKKKIVLGNVDSPVIKRKNRNAIRLISSDSDSDSGS